VTNSHLSREKGEKGALYYHQINCLLTRIYDRCSISECNYL